MQGLEPRCVPTVMLSCAGTAHTRAPTRAHTHTDFIEPFCATILYMDFLFLIWKTSEHFFFTDSKVSVAEIH